MRSVHDENGSGVLLVLRADGVLLPVYESALNLAEGWPWNIKRAYAGARMIRGTGAVLRVKNVVITKPYGKSPLSKIFSVLNSNWEIALKTEREEASDKDIVQALLHGLSLDRSAGRNLFDTRKAELAGNGSNTKNLSIEEIFRELHLNSAEFVALDSL